MRGSGPEHHAATQPAVTPAPQTPHPPRLLGHEAQHSVESANDLGWGDRGMRKRKRETVSEDRKTGCLGSLSVHPASPHGPGG